MNWKNIFSCVIYSMHDFFFMYRFTIYGQLQALIRCLLFTTMYFFLLKDKLKAIYVRNALLLIKYTFAYFLDEEY